MCVGARETPSHRFGMKLDPQDDQPRYVVGEFRLDHDGWYTYYGWPTGADKPFQFTPRGTNIKGLIYGNLGIARELKATVLPQPPACTKTITGRHCGRLVIADGMACLEGATVTGPVGVQSGASLLVSDASIRGPVSTTGADTVRLVDSVVCGPVSISKTTGEVGILTADIAGPVSLRGNNTEHAVNVAGNVINGSLRCGGNAPDPSDLGVPNSGNGPRGGQRASL